MSASAQAIWFFIAVLGCLLAAFWGYLTVENRKGPLGFHPGWLGLAAFAFVFFWIAVKAS